MNELERELFGPYDADEFCNRYCDDDRHAKFCLLSIGGERERHEEMERELARRAIYPACPFCGSEAAARPVDRYEHAQFCGRCGAFFGVIQYAADVTRAGRFLADARPVDVTHWPEGRRVRGRVHPANAGGAARFDECDHGSGKCVEAEQA